MKKLLLILGVALLLFGCPKKSETPVTETTDTTVTATMDTSPVAAVEYYTLLNHPPANRALAQGDKVYVTPDGQYYVTKPGIVVPIPADWKEWTGGGGGGGA